MKRFITGMLTVVTILTAGTRVYDVELSESDNGMAGPPNWVGQTFVQICDTLKWADIFIGKSIPQGDYYVEICDSLGGGSVLASGETTAVAGEYEFVRVRLSTAPGAEMFKRGAWGQISTFYIGIDE